MALTTLGKTNRPPSKPEVAALIMLSLFFGGMMIVALFQEYSVYKLSVPIFLFSWAVLLVIHEFGHALMAKALGWRVEKISIGTGKLIGERTIFGMPSEFRAIPLSGFVIPRPVNLIRPQLKSCLIYAAGPGIEIVWVGICWLVLGTDTLFSRQPELWLIIIQSFCAAAAFGAMINLIPIPFQTERGNAASDGLGMILAWKTSDKQFAESIKPSES